MSDDIAKILFGDPDEPLAELAPYDHPTLDGCKPTPLTPSLSTSLSALLQFAPSLTTSVAQAVTKVYTVSFSPEVMQRMQRMMEARGSGFRAIGVDKSGQIVGHGTLNSASKLRRLASLTAVWQVMAVVTAQVHLAEINARLAQIERGINEIKDWLKNDQIATLLNAQRYVAEIRQAFVTRSLTERDIAVFDHQLERLWVDCGQVELALQLTLDARAQQFTQLDLSSFWGLDGQVATAKDGIDQYEQLVKSYLLALQTRAALVCGRAALPLSPEITVQRIETLRAVLQQHEYRMQHFFATARSYVRQRLSARIHIGTTNGTYRGKVLGTADEAEARLWRSARDVQTVVDEIEQHLDTQRQIAERPYTLLITLNEQGAIVGSYRPLEG